MIICAFNGQFYGMRWYFRVKKMCLAGLCSCKSLCHENKIRYAICYNNISSTTVIFKQQWKFAHISSSSFISKIAKRKKKLWSFHSHLFSVLAKFHSKLYSPSNILNYKLNSQRKNRDCLWQRREGE